MKKKDRIICVVTGTRAEYGLLRPIMYAIRKNKSLTLQLIVTGMHLSTYYGKTLNYILKDGFEIDAQVPMTPKGDSTAHMAESVGVGIVGISKALNRLCPDIVLVLGDRVEALAAAIAAVYMGICVAHVHGGDSAEAGIDENTRHAITKLSNIHFPATQKSASRILKMGEEKSRIFVTGAPGLDDIGIKNYASKKEIANTFNLGINQPSIMLVQHSVTTEVQSAAMQMKETLEAIVKLRIQTIIIYPNSDAGGKAMIKLIKSYGRKFPWLKIYKSIPRYEYLGLLNTVSVLVGNSSSGIIESASFHIPVVNIGTRQNGRERSNNIINVGYNGREIVGAINRALNDKVFLRKIKKSLNPYGDGGSGAKIAQNLLRVNLDSKLLKKKITY